MFERLKYLWIPRLCFALTVTGAAVLALAVGVAPWLDDADTSAETWRLFVIFARDGLVRRTALVCAAGLVVTACVFFRATPPPARKKKKPKPAAPPHIPGA